MIITPGYGVIVKQQNSINRSRAERTFFPKKTLGFTSTSKVRNMTIFYQLPRKKRQYYKSVTHIFHVQCTMNKSSQVSGVSWFLFLEFPVRTLWAFQAPIWQGELCQGEGNTDFTRLEKSCFPVSMEDWCCGLAQLIMEVFYLLFQSWIQAAHGEGRTHTFSPWNGLLFLSELENWLSDHQHLPFLQNMANYKKLCFSTSNPYSKE